MKKFLLVLAGAAMAAASSFGAATELYGIGGCFGGWEPDKGTKLEGKDGVFTTTLEIEGTQYFAFCEKLGTWADINATRYAPAVKDTEAKPGVELEMKYGVDASWKILPGKYVFTVDTNKMIFTVTEDGSTERVITYGLKGQLDGLTDSDWKEYPFTKGDSDDVWTATITPSVSGGEFGMMQLTNGSQSDWYSAKVSFDAENTSAALNGEPAGNCVFDYPAAKAYTFTFTVSTKTLSIVPVGDGAVEGITIDNAAPVYFNLQGVQVENPENGLFIVVKGGKAEKVVF